MNSLILALSIYGYPAATTVMAGRGALEPEWGLDVPLGARAQLTETTAIDLELELMGLGFSGSAKPRGWGGSVALGPSFRLWRGLWVDAHARFTLYHSVLSTFARCPPGAICALSNGPADLGPGYTRAFTAEVDIGYEWRFGRVYLSPAIGIGGGYAYDFVDPNGSRLLTPFSARTVAGRRTEGFVWTLNLNLLRVGVSL